MQNWFEAVVEHEESHHQTGKITKFKEMFLVDAMTFTEAEARLQEKIKEFAKREYDITKLGKIKIEELVDGGEYTKWFKVKVVYLIPVESKQGEVIEEEIEVEDGGEVKTKGAVKVKKRPSISIIHADTAEEACRLITEHVKDSMFDFTVSEVKEYDLLDYFPYIGK
jgi:hypothetical protein